MLSLDEFARANVPLRQQSNMCVAYRRDITAKSSVNRPFVLICCRLHGESIACSLPESSCLVADRSFFAIALGVGKSCGNRVKVTTRNALRPPWFACLLACLLCFLSLSPTDIFPDGLKQIVFNTLIVFIELNSVSCSGVRILVVGLSGCGGGLRKEGAGWSGGGRNSLDANARVGGWGNNFEPRFHCLLR